MLSSIPCGAIAAEVRQTQQSTASVMLAHLMAMPRASFHRVPLSMPIRQVASPRPLAGGGRGKGSKHAIFSTPPDLFDPSPRPPPTRAYKGRGVFFPAPIAVSFTAGRPPGRSSTRNDRPGRAPSLSQQSIRHPGARSPIQQRPHLRGQRGVAERLWQQMRAGVQDSPRHDRVAPIAGGEQYQQVRAVNQRRRTWQAGPRQFGSTGLVPLRQDGPPLAQQFASGATKRPGDAAPGLMHSCGPVGLAGGMDRFLVHDVVVGADLVHRVVRLDRVVSSGGCGGRGGRRDQRNGRQEERERGNQGFALGGHGGAPGNGRRCGEGS